MCADLPGKASKNTSNTMETVGYRETYQGMRCSRTFKEKMNRQVQDKEERSFNLVTKTHFSKKNIRSTIMINYDISSEASNAK